MMEELHKKIGAVFLPGDVILPSTNAESLFGAKTRFGGGIRQEGANIVAFKAGILKVSESRCCIWIETNQKRYVATKNDTIIGIITSRGIDSYKVDIGCSHLASLNNLAFEGATKRHKPNLKIDDLVFAKLTVANKDMEPELSCVDEHGKSNNLGPINDGYMFAVPFGLSRQLLKMPESRVLSLLGKHFCFEIVIGMNGRVWISAKNIIDTIAISNAIISAQFMEDNQITVMVKQLIDSIAGFNDED